MVNFIGVWLYSSNFIRTQLLKLGIFLAVSYVVGHSVIILFRINKAITTCYMYVCLDNSYKGGVNMGWVCWGE